MTDRSFRLPTEAAPNRYDVLLEPDLDAATFRGHVAIRLDVHAPTTTLVCNAAELQIASAKVKTATGTHTPTIALDEATERCTLTLPVELDPGPVTVEIVFTGVLNDRLRGWYRSTYVDASGHEQVIATSQMQSTDCRRAFPCWDEPELKAVFGITLVVDPALMAISNSPEASRTSTDRGKVAIRFEDTMVMSSYLVAMVVGTLEATEPVDVGGVPLRVIHVPGKQHLTAFGLEIGAFALKWFQDYYGIPYPGQKVDLLALPDFAAGAMENLGCITFREALLLVDPATATQSEEQNIADVVAHELAHMWFGDLVTMRWWNGIWLNEAFATFMEMAACDAFRGEWQRWTTFSVERTSAYDTDALLSTRPVEYEVVSPQDAEGMFDVLTYIKGGALLRMLQQYLGEDAFREGVRHYLTKHAYGNTETSDLWDAMEHVSGEPARQIMDSWIWQGGFPVVSVTVAGDELVLSQRRFVFADDDPEAAAAATTRWSIPVQLRQTSGGALREEKLLLAGDSARVALLAPDAAVMANAGAHGFYRVAYAPELLARLTGEQLGALSTPERYALLEDAWAGVLVGTVRADEFCRFANGYAGERQLQVWQFLLASLRFLDRLVEGDERSRYQLFVRQLVGPALADVGWEPTAGEDPLQGELRGQLIRAMAVLGADPASAAQARSLYAASAGDSTAVSPPVAAACAAVVAATGSAAEYDEFVERFRRAGTPQERQRFLHLLAEFPTAELMDRTIAFSFSKEVRTQDAPFLIAFSIANRDQGWRAWTELRKRWDSANTAFPSNTIRSMVSSVRLLMHPEQQADVAGFFAEHPIPQATKSLAQVLERQRVNVAVREREHERFGASLA